MTVSLVVAGMLARFWGGSGLVKIIPPLPALARSEVPTTFVAEIVAYMLAPHGKLKGEACRVEIGIVQLRAVMIPAFYPLQLANSAEKVNPSLCLMVIVYAVMGDPPLNGATHVTTALVFEITEVVGAVGVLGFDEALI